VERAVQRSVDPRRIKWLGDEFERPRRESERIIRGEIEHRPYLLPKRLRGIAERGDRASFLDHDVETEHGRVVHAKLAEDGAVEIGYRNLHPRRYPNWVADRRSGSERAGDRVIEYGGDIRRGQPFGIRNWARTSHDRYPLFA